MDAFPDLEPHLLTVMRGDERRVTNGGGPGFEAHDPKQRARMLQADQAWDLLDRELEPAMLLDEPKGERAGDRAGPQRGAWCNAS